MLKNSLFVLLVFGLFTVSAVPNKNNGQKFNPDAHVALGKKFAKRNELLVSVPKNSVKNFSLTNLKSKNAAWSKVESVRSLWQVKIGNEESQLFKLEGKHLLSNSADLNKYLQEDLISSVHPNYVYNIGMDPRDHNPNDPKFVDQYHHLLMKSDSAWDHTQGQHPTLKIAITDDGFAMNHPDLKENMWINEKEIPSNQIDDDNNGYIDDVSGWDFADNDNDPVNPDNYSSHGTHVAGIAAGRTDNSVGISGTAGLAKILPIRFYGYGDWTTEIVSASFRYAVQQDAKIISTSYNIDGFVGDEVFEDALEFVHASGTLHFGSAGNSGIQNPVRANYGQILFVASTNKKDEKSSYSNYGKCVDLAAPGEDILSSIPNEAWEKMSGTSMAAPNAAGVAALVWSHNPDLNRDQVAALLYASSDNIDSLNTRFVGGLGGGRLNSMNATSSQGVTRAPKVRAFSHKTTKKIDEDMRSVEVSVLFDQLLDPESADNSENWRIEKVQDDASTEIVQQGLQRPWRIATNEALFNLAAIKKGNYRLTISSQVENPFGVKLDGVGTDSSTVDYVQNFIVE